MKIVFYFILLLCEKKLNITFLHKLNCNVILTTTNFVPFFVKHQLIYSKTESQLYFIPKIFQMTFNPECHQKPFTDHSVSNRVQITLIGPVQNKHTVYLLSTLYYHANQFILHLNDTSCMKSIQISADANILLLITSYK